MKLNALERATADDRDYQDAIKLGVECGVSTVDGLKNIFRMFFGDTELPLTSELRLNELAKAVQAKLRG
jgi:hypothetical protein